MGAQGQSPADLPSRMSSLGLSGLGVYPVGKRPSLFNCALPLSQEGEDILYKVQVGAVVETAEQEGVR